MSTFLSWEYLHPRATEYHVGYIGQSITDTNPKSAAEQISILYRFGGWKPFSKGKIGEKTGDGFFMNLSHHLSYPGDPPLHPIARTKLRDELIFVYTSDWWAIVQPDGSFEVARLD